MVASDSWLRKRNRIRREIAKAFSERCGIGFEDFLRIFYDSQAPQPISDFNSQYVPDGATLDAILAGLAESISIEPVKVRSHYKKEESFPQFGEHLLRAGAYGSGSSGNEPEAKDE